MLIVRTFVHASKIAGIGLFADERITKGTVIWKFNPRFDITFDPEEVDDFSPIQKDFFDTYAYLSKDIGKYVCSLDDSRFMNHSSIHDNVEDVLLEGEIEGVSVAKKDIERGEELLINYRTFDGHDEVSNEEYLNT